MIIAPSLLSANFSCLEEEIKKLEDAKADWLHLDVMDGNFVPNITFGPCVIKSIRKITDMPFDVHLMIEEPEKHYLNFLEAGANIITVHAEATKSLYRLLDEIKKNCKAGVAINPATPLSSVENVLDIVDLILIMTVEPGFGGQKFIDKMVEKVRMAKKIIGKRKIYLAVDGGVNDKNAKILKKAGANVLVSGSYIFRSKNYEMAIKKLRF
ncbi:MAG: ribulose-phosphate 3-epimerase [Thermoplasmatales archaeon]|nr:ribulose-phosphate 3-epimerase [Thermoplasmatales archaeon]